jgi:hypothetical protein
MNGHLKEDKLSNEKKKNLNFVCEIKVMMKKIESFHKDMVYFLCTTTFQIIDKQNYFTKLLCPFRRKNWIFVVGLVHLS